MTQVGSISNANSQPQVNNDNTIKNGDDKSNIILDKGTENLIKKETSLENTEKLKFGGRTNPKPESTMHKVGRYLTKILGGLCLVAGVAAAVAATVASCGIGGAVLAGAAGVLTGTLGITGTSVLAGAAGATGIGLLVGSSKMKPTDPKALLPQPELKPETQKVNLTTFGADDAKVIENVLKEKYGYDVNSSDDSGLYSIQRGLAENNRNYALGKIIGSVKIEGEQTYNTVNEKSFGLQAIRDCVRNTLELHGVKEPFEASEKNMLLVRHAIDSYLSDDKNMLSDKESAVLNTPQVKKDLNVVLDDYMKLQHHKDDEPLIEIFRGALNLESVEIPKPQQNLIGTNLIIDEDVPVVSMNKQDIANDPVNAMSMNPRGPQDFVNVPTVSMNAPKKVEQPKNQVLLGEEQIPGITQILTGQDKNFVFVEPEGGIGELQHFCQNGYEGVGGNTHLVNADGLYTYLGNMLKANGVTSYGLTPKNVLLARLGISNFLKDMGHYETYFTGEDMQKELREYFKDQMEANEPGKRWRSEERYQMSAILLSVFTPNDSKGNVVLKG